MLVDTFVSFAVCGSYWKCYAPFMGTSDQTRLSASVRKRLEKLETSVSTLIRELGELRTAMTHHGLTVAANDSIPLRRTSGGQGRQRRTPHSGSSAAPVARGMTGLKAAISRGEAAKVEWVSAGEVIPAKALAAKWGLTPQALGPASDRGEVFAVVIKRRRFYPREFLELSRDDIGAVSKALGDISPVQKLVFWKRQHGALGGKSVVELLRGDSNGQQLDKVARYAKTWAADASVPARAR